MIMEQRQSVITTVVIIMAFRLLTVRVHLEHAIWLETFLSGEIHFMENSIQLSVLDVVVVGTGYIYVLPSWKRYWRSPGLSNKYIGFRCVTFF